MVWVYFLADVLRSPVLFRNQAYLFQVGLLLDTAKRCWNTLGSTACSRQELRLHFLSAPVSSAAISPSLLTM